MSDCKDSVATMLGFPVSSHFMRTSEPEKGRLGARFYVIRVNLGLSEVGRGRCNFAGV